MDYKDKNVTIGDVVAELPSSSQIFSQYGIDFCCGGNNKLYVVIKEKGLDEARIYQELETAKKDRMNSYKDSNYNMMNSKALTDYIEDTHHAYLRRVMPEISELLTTVLRVHGRNHPELFEVYKLFGALKTDLEQHLLKEETMLFPAFSDEKERQEEILQMTDEIIKEHVNAGQILEKLRNITKDYRIPEDACGTYQKVYRMLEEMEKDLHQHIHLENNILLKNYDRR